MIFYWRPPFSNILHSLSMKLFTKQWKIKKFSMKKISHKTFSGNIFEKKKHPQKDLNLGYLPDSNKRMRGSKKNCLVETDPIHISEIKGQRPDSVKIL